MMLDLPSRPLPSLSPAIEALLVHERDIVPQPGMVRARALARAREALRPAEVVRYTPRPAWSPVRRLLFGAAAGVSLMAGAAAAYQMLRRPEPFQPSGPEATRAVRPASVAPSSAESAPEPIPAPKASSPETSEPSLRARASGKPDAPPEELRLLVRARRADARGDYLAVLAIAAEHERRHPTGRLSEEREALRIKALVGVKRGSEARQAAGKFRRQFPRSVLLHKIDDMLASLR